MNAQIFINLIFDNIAIVILIHSIQDPAFGFICLSSVCCFLSKLYDFNFSVYEFTHLPSSEDSVLFLTWQFGNLIFIFIVCLLSYLCLLSC